MKFTILLIVLFINTICFGQVYSPKDLEEPHLDSIGFIIDPDNKIEAEWKWSMFDSRKTYFFPRYIEPICVRIDDIKSPSDPDDFIAELATLWELEEKTNGRYVLQLVVMDQESIVYNFGSQVAPFYSRRFIRELTKDITEVHLNEFATGTGSFVSLQRLGDQIFDKIAFDSEIVMYEGNNGIHNYYPDEIEKSDDLTRMTKSYYEEGKGYNYEFSIPEREVDPSDLVDYSEKSYFEGLSESEINKNYSAIDTDGLITNIEDVINSREVDNNRISDPHNILNQFAEDTINSLIWDIENTVDYEIAVVCLNSIGSNNPHDWGLELFNLWGIGDSKTDNGLLMLLINDVHRIEFITGRGTETVLTDGLNYVIQQEEMIPHFKKNDYVTGMIRGVQAVRDVFFGEPPLYSSGDEDYNYDDNVIDYEYDDYTEYKSTPFYETELFKFYALLTGGITGLYLLLVLIAFMNRDLYKRYRIVKLYRLLIIPILFPIPFLLIYFLNKSLMEKWRNTDRFSLKNGQLMHRLSETDDDKHLSKGQVAEEIVKSIDYDVWATQDGSDILILAYRKWFSKYNKCPKCRHKTYWKVYDRTISAATYSSSGTGEKKYQCENCGHTKITRYTIPQRTRSSSSSSGGYSSGSGGYSGGYSSGGSSYGGGSSGGGGAGSSW